VRVEASHRDGQVDSTASSVMATAVMPNLVGRSAAVAEDELDKPGVTRTAFGPAHTGEARLVKRIAYEDCAATEY
jgi:hypothetical protein